MVGKNEVGELVIISGMSGAGKTVAIQSFEDLGYYCVDNLPPTLLPTFLELMVTSTHNYDRVAVVMDLRGRDFFEQLFQVIKEVEAVPYIDVRILFLDADDRTLVKRYKETRRNHPLAPHESPLKGIEQERKLLSTLKEMAKYIYNTTGMKPKELREKIMDQFSPSSGGTFQVIVMSFGYKHGIPIDTDLALDVRFLPNPFYIEELREKTGLDQEVSSYVLQQKETGQFIEKLTNLLDFCIPQYVQEGRSQIVIAIGCTGGQHRSVTLAEYLYQFYQKKYATNILHRDAPLINAKVL